MIHNRGPVKGGGGFPGSSVVCLLKFQMSCQPVFSEYMYCVFDSCHCQKLIWHYSCLSLFHLSAVAWWNLPWQDLIRARQCLSEGYVNGSSCISVLFPDFQPRNHFTPPPPVFYHFQLLFVCLFSLFCMCVVIK